MKTNESSVRSEGLGRRLVRQAVFWSIATLVLSGCAAAIGLVGLFVFPLLPLLGFFMLIQGSALLGRSEHERLERAAPEPEAKAPPASVLRALSQSA